VYFLTMSIAISGPQRTYGVSQRIPPRARGQDCRALLEALAGGGTSTPAGLAWIADSIASGLSQVIGPLARATSLDNTIRYAAAAQSEWVLVDVHAHAAADGYVHLFSENGMLLATGSQTCAARVAVS
jgi:Thioesterase-like superfamily